MKLASGLGLLFLIICEFAHAEGGSCPNGYYPIGGQGVSGCAPIPNYDADSQDRADAKPLGKWITTWSAIAIDSAVGDVGVSSGEFTEVDAKEKALRRCKQHGATECRVTTYHNQCAVIAWPINADAKAVMVGAETIELASKLALSQCASSGGGSCNIVSAQCSRPAFEKF